MDLPCYANFYFNSHRLTARLSCVSWPVWQLTRSPQIIFLATLTTCTMTDCLSYQCTIDLYTLTIQTCIVYPLGRLALRIQEKCTFAFICVCLKVHIKSRDQCNKYQYYTTRESKVNNWKQVVKPTSVHSIRCFFMFEIIFLTTNAASSLPIKTPPTVWPLNLWYIKGGLSLKIKHLSVRHSHKVLME